MGNLVNVIEFANVGELRHEEEYCLSRRILGILSYGGKGWLQSTLLAFILQNKANELLSLCLSCQYTNNELFKANVRLHINLRPSEKHPLFLLFSRGTLKFQIIGGAQTPILANFTNPF